MAYIHEDVKPYDEANESGKKQQQLQAEKIIGLDISTEMLEVGKNKVAKTRSLQYYQP